MVTVKAIYIGFVGRECNRKTTPKSKLKVVIKNTTLQIFGLQPYSFFARGADANTVYLTAVIRIKHNKGKCFFVKALR